MVQKVKDFYKKYERWMPIVFFVLGFVFDAFMLRRIDELLTIIQQAVYLFICAVLIGVELVELTREVHPPRILIKIWKYREPVLHFFMGTLLNAYTIFYFKSASALTSFIFIFILVGLLIINEFKRFGKAQTKVHVAFLSLCIISYFVSLAPILIGFIGILPFLCANAAAAGAAFWFYKILKSKLSDQKELLKTHVIIPFAGIQIFFALLYFGHAIPPVPLSVSYMGIYHNIERKDGEFELSYTRSKYKFWQHGDQTFLARPGDTVFCYARIFSPSRFKDELQVRWLFFDERRSWWQSSDAIPLPITGGREEGYRGVTKKINYQPGRWRVQVETKDNREIGRIDFTVVRDESTEPREVKTKLD